MKATDRKPWISLLGGAAIKLGSFGLVFRDKDISDNISDWSYFGAYVGGCFGIVSVVLIYLTFREQSKNLRWAIRRLTADSLVVYVHKPTVILEGDTLNTVGDTVETFTRK